MPKKKRQGRAPIVSKLTLVRRDNLRALIEREGGPSSLAKKLGHSGPSYLSQLASGKSPITEKVVRKIEQQLGLPEFALDVKPGEGVPFAGTDHALLASSIRAVGEELERAKKEPGAKKFSELVAIVYENAVKTGSVDARYVQSLIRLL